MEKHKIGVTQAGNKGTMKENKKDNQTTALCFISQVAGRGKLYIVILLLVQMVLGISSVFYALLLRGIIDAAVSHDKDGMMLHILFFASLVVGRLPFGLCFAFWRNFPNQPMRMPLRKGSFVSF